MCICLLKNSTRQKTASASPVICPHYNHCKEELKVIMQLFLQSHHAVISLDYNHCKEELKVIMQLFLLIIIIVKKS